ncbi:hypothetical protein H6G17_31730 [Chroococcidiopsis sp. FACHB-1243]|uniref:hypothetical protein n=1 Tax=Chroococcidiopsis sp. [FACHB-1243] TaxID=2692781 RepID=UPI00177F20F2|nr:hypothetical protein [Chroococcidiopsis sp. [FACHB-1243]]MBD2309973.1 hypothetical protein [Chroococcidiopsis sp. [FACHB-1243]]
MQVVTSPLEAEFSTNQHATVEDLVRVWRWQLAFDYANLSVATRESIVCWLFENNPERLTQLNPKQLQLVQKGIAYRYRILKHRYLGQAPEQSYRRLLKRLNSLALLQNKIRMTIALSRDRRRRTIEVLQEFLQDLLLRDRYLQQQIKAIASCTDDLRLRHALLFATVEEYCLRPVRSQPLIVHRFINYMRRLGSGGITKVPRSRKIRIVVAQLSWEDSDRTLSLLDAQAIEQYNEQQDVTEQQQQCEEVKQQLSEYIEQKLGFLAVKWLNLYLQGQSQQAIATRLNMTTKEVYRLREKVCYHATRLFQN